MNTNVTVDGLDEALRARRRRAGTPADAKAMNKAVVDKIIVPRAKAEVPVRSGDLKASIDSDATAMYGIITAGGRGSVAYAGVIHFGWSTRGLGSKVSGTAKEKRAKLKGAVGGSKALTSRSTNKAVRLSGNRKGKGKVRGGPIAPQPFIYEAVDQRQNEVFKFYEQQLEDRARIEDLL